MKHTPPFIVRSALLILAIFLTACVSEKTVKIGKEEWGEIRGKRLVTTVGDPAFTVVAPGGAAMPLSDIAAADTAGGQRVKLRDVRDPAVRIGSDLADHLASELAMVVGSRGDPVAEETVESLSSMYTGTDYILDIRTKIWEARSTSAASNKYFVAYAATIRLIDTGKKQIIAKGVCRRTKPQARTQASLAQLSRDEGGRLKSELKEIEDHCIEMAKRDILPGWRKGGNLEKTISWLGTIMYELPRALISGRG